MKAYCKPSVWHVLPVVIFFFGTLPLTYCTGPSKEESTTDASPADQSINDPSINGDTTQKDNPPQERAISQKPLDVGLAADEVRVGKITKDSERITGPEALSAIGDWKIYNSKVAFVIHGKRFSQTWSTSTGHVIDASPVDTNGRATHDLLEEIFPIVSLLRVVVAKKIEIIEPGGPGKQAILRVTASNAGIPIIDSVLKTANVEGTLEIDYILKPGETHLEIITRLQDDARDRAISLGDGILFGDRTRWIAPLKGWNIKKVVGLPIPWLGTTSPKVSYALAPKSKDASLQVPIAQAAVFPAIGGEAKEDVKVAEYKRWLFVGHGGLEEILVALRKLRKQTDTKELKGTVKGILKGVAVSVTANNNKGVVLSQTWAKSNGEFSFGLKAGEYTIVAAAEGYKTVSTKAKPGDTPSLTFVPRATVTIELAEKKLNGNTEPFVPARIEIKGKGFSKLVDLITPKQPIHLPSGSYTMLISRGLNYEYIQKKIELKEGQTLALKETLVEAVDTSGYVSADMHLHASPSADSTLPMEQRVSALAAEGIMFAVSSDHDVWTDYAPTVKTLKLEKWLKTAIGQEVSPFGFHSNGYPLKKLPQGKNRYFSVPWSIYKKGTFQKFMEAPEIYKGMREQFKVPIIQINHPRGSQALLSYVGYDPKKGIKALKPGRFDNNWDVIEAYNGTSREDFLTKTLFDYFSFLNQGWYKTAVGNSDSHTAGRRPGLARSLIRSKQANPVQIDMDEIIDSLKKNRAILYAGPMIRLTTSEGEAPGARIQKPSIDLNIEIQAPSWIAVSYVKLYANGKLQETYPVTASKNKVRFKKTVKLSPKKDTWYIVMAGDDKVGMAPVYPGVFPISMTNPLYLDIDGNGFKPTWQP